MPVSVPMVGAHREEAMKRKNMAFGGAAVLTAAAAIGAGVMVSSGAMAAAGTDPAGAVISMVNIGDDGSAITCQFSAADLPFPAPGDAAPGTVHGSGVLVTATNGTPPPAGTKVSGGPSFSTGSGTNGPVLIGPGPGAPPDGSVPEGALTVTGSMSSDGTATAVRVNADGSTSPLEVRDGTPEECANALKAMQSATVSSATATAGVPDAGTSKSDG